MDEIKFNESDAEEYPALGPAYFASQRFAGRLMEGFREEHLQPIVKMIADAVSDKLWDDARDYLLSDTENNVAGAVREMVEQTVEALLTGKEWAMNRYPYADYSKGEEIRAAVAKHGGDKLLMARIADLEATIAKRDETISFLRRQY